MIYGPGENISILHSWLTSAVWLLCFQLERLQKTVGDTSSNLGAATSELTSLKNEVSQLTQQLDKANHELKSVSSQHNSIKVMRVLSSLYSSIQGRFIFSFCFKVDSVSWLYAIPSQQVNQTHPVLVVLMPYNGQDIFKVLITTGHSNNDQG